MDETEKFLDGSELPCILVENKVDLLDPNKANDLRDLKKFSDDNGFITCFRTSAKTGFNLNEAMSYLIDNIFHMVLIYHFLLILYIVIHLEAICEIFLKC